MKKTVMPNYPATTKVIKQIEKIIKGYLDTTLNEMREERQMFPSNYPSEAFEESAEELFITSPDVNRIPNMLWGNGEELPLDWLEEFRLALLNYWQPRMDDNKPLFLSPILQVTIVLDTEGINTYNPAVYTGLTTELDKIENCDKVQIGPHDYIYLIREVIKLASVFDDYNCWDKIQAVAQYPTENQTIKYETYH